MTILYPTYFTGPNKDNIRAGCKKCGYRKYSIYSIKQPINKQFSLVYFIT